MALTSEQIKELKSQLESQTSHLEPQQKAQAQKQIDEMSPEALETMLQEQQSQQKIFRLIIEGQIPAVKLEENSKAVAVLSTKAISKGHTLIIPKSPFQEESQLPKEINDLSEKISKKLIESLKAKSTSVIPQKAFGEIILNIIPIYDSPLTLQSPAEDKTPEELEKIKTAINIEKITKAPTKIKIEKPVKAKALKIPRRIP
jgi:hypothetical protein